jgi:hypothetical protein
MSTLSVTTVKADTLQTVAGVEVYTAKAWVNFNGTGTVAIRASGNVSSITDNGTGDYTVNFTTAMPDANYSVTSNAFGDNLTSNPRVAAMYGTPTTSAFSLWSRAGSATTSGGNADSSLIHLSVFR